MILPFFLLVSKFTFQSGFSADGRHSLCPGDQQRYWDMLADLPDPETGYHKNPTLFGVGLWCCAYDSELLTLQVELKSMPTQTEMYRLRIVVWMMKFLKLKTADVAKGGLEISLMNTSKRHSTTHQTRNRLDGM